MQAFKFWSGEWQRAITGITGYNKAVVSLEPSPMLLGVGYIIGPRIASVMVGGGILTALLLVPMIAYFGDGLPGVLPPGQQPIAELSAGAISGQYVRYIGAGAVATGGILSMLNALPLIVASVPAACATCARASRPASGGVPRTERDLPMPLVVFGSLGLVLAIAASHLIPTDFTGRLIGGAHDRALRVPVRDGQLADHRRDRLVVQPDLRDDDRHAALDLPDLRRAGLGRAGVSPDGAVDRRGRLHRLVQRRHDLAGPQDRLPGRRDALEAAGRDPGRGA